MGLFKQELSPYASQVPHTKFIIVKIITYKFFVIKEWCSVNVGDRSQTR